MREPEWAVMGYGVGGSYTAECKECGTVAVLDFKQDGMHKLSVASDTTGSEKTELYAYVFFWTLEKLRRECDCDRNF